MNNNYFQIVKNIIVQKKLRCCLLLCALLSTNLTYSQVEPTVAPLNPDYIKYLEELSQGKIIKKTEEGKGLGYIPPPNVTQTIIQTEEITIPQKHDLRANDTHYTPDKGMEFGESDFNSIKKSLINIKKTILKHGPLYVGMRWEDVSYNPKKKTYYYKGNKNANHVVIIYGWDDNKRTEGGKGAWIAKNLWGNAWGENGFFYVSYNDKKFFSGINN